MHICIVAGSMRFLKRLVILTDLLIAPCLFFNNHTAVLALLTPLSSLNTTPLLPNHPICTSTPHFPGRHLHHLPSSDLLDKTRVLLSLAEQFKILIR
jgi:hypothetical protein